MTIDTILTRPYHWIVEPDEEGWSARILEFDGCFAQGDSAQEALANLQRAAVAWVEGVIDDGRVIPDPIAPSDYSGRFVLRLPKRLHQEAALQASFEGVSLNTFIVSALSYYLGGEEPVEFKAGQVHRGLAVNSEDLGLKDGQTYVCTAFKDPGGQLVIKEELIEEDS